jgi:hypothetical protein
MYWIQRLTTGPVAGSCGQGNEYLGIHKKDFSLAEQLLTSQE